MNADVLKLWPELEWIEDEAEAKNKILIFSGSKKVLDIVE